ncbi:MAG: molybdopterin-dependent oxidoreductase [Ardenticatenia bacterium]|nr:molybdopterin-dependent oxidoreductase [Ardenticatenia bacterium]
MYYPRLRGHAHVITDAPEVANAWRGTLEFILTSHPLDCPVCDKGGECPLQDLTFKYGPDLSRFYVPYKMHFQKPVPLGELIWLDRERCIYCSRCIRFCEEIANDPVLEFADRGRAQEIVTFSDPPFDSYFSGNTTDICPVGALTTEDFRFKARVWELRNVPSICPHCPVGCNIVIGERAGDIKRIMPRANEWVNEIWICDKGRFGHHFVGADDRLTAPLIRGEDGQFRAATWPEALDYVANRLAAIISTHGPRAVGGIAGARAANEDLYVFVKFFRDVLGSPNVDHRVAWPTGTGIEQAVAHVGLASGSNLASLGPGSLILLVGSDLEEEQPVSYLRVRRARRNGATVVVAQARPVKEEAEAAHLLRYRVGGEAHVMAAILKVVLEAHKNALDKRFNKLKGAQQVREAVADLSLDELARISGVSAEHIRAVAEVVVNARDVVIMVGREALVGAEENAPALVDAAVALLAATGKAGQVNSGLVALWPHNNSQGACDMGVLPDMLPGYRPADEAGATVDDMLSGAADLKALYIMAADPARDRPSSLNALKNVELLIVQDLFMTETARLAHVVFPAAAFAERAGSYTSLERRVQRTEQALRPPGEAMPDWWIVAQLAERFDAAWPPYATAVDIMNEVAKQVKVYKGMSYDKLEGEPVSWSTVAGYHHVYTGTSTLNTWFGRTWAVQAEARRPKYALRWSGLRPPRHEEGVRLVARRRLYDHGTMIARSHLLDRRRARPEVLISSQEAARLGLEEQGGAVRVQANGVTLVTAARVEPRLPADVAVVACDVDGTAWNALTEGGVRAPFGTLEKAEEAVE